MTRFAVSLLRLATLALFGTASSLASAQALIDQSKVLAGNVTPGDAAGFPLTLSAPGHYRLTGNLLVPAGVEGVVITAPDVTLDLNGFSISGPNVCTRNNSTKAVTCSMVGTGYTLNGIRQNDFAAQRVTVRNGSIKGFSGSGILGGDNLRMEGLQIAHNGGWGYTAGQNAQTGFYAENLAIELNGLDGVNTGYGLMVRSRVSGNGRDGVSGGSQVVVQDSLVRQNFRYGLNGVAVRGSRLAQNGVNRNAVTSMGDNLDAQTPF